MAQPGATGSFACCIEIPLTRDWNLDNRIQLFQSSPFSLLCFLFLFFFCLIQLRSASPLMLFCHGFRCLAMLGDAWRCFLGDFGRFFEALVGIIGSFRRCFKILWGFLGDSLGFFEALLQFIWDSLGFLGDSLGFFGIL